MSTDTKPANSAFLSTLPHPRRLGLRSGSLRVGFWTLVLGLVGLNLWLAWEARPLADLNTISEWISQERYTAAERELRAHLRRSQHHGEARLMLAKVLAARKDLLGSAEQLHQVPAWWPKKHEALFREGQFAMAAGRAKQAESAWRACLANDPFHPTPPREFTASVHELVTLYNLEERREDARELLWWAYQQADPANHTSILTMRIWIELLQNDPAESVERLRQFVASSPDDWNARRALARTELALGNAPEATRHIKLCLHAQPMDPRAWRDFLAILTKQGDRSGMAAALAQLPPAADQDGEIWKYRGMFLERTGALTEAVHAYGESIRLQPSEEEAYYKLALLDDRLGARVQAEAHRQRYQQLHEARSQLRTTYDAYLDITNRPQVGSTRLSDTITRFAELCETLGWEREANAWRLVLKKR